MAQEIKTAMQHIGQLTCAVAQVYPLAVCRQPQACSSEKRQITAINA